MYSLELYNPILPFVMAHYLFPMDKTWSSYGFSPPALPSPLGWLADWRWSCSSGGWTWGPRTTATLGISVATQLAQISYWKAPSALHYIWPKYSNKPYEPEPCFQVSHNTTPTPTGHARLAHFTLNKEFSFQILFKVSMSTKWKSLPIFCYL